MVKWNSGWNCVFRPLSKMKHKKLKSISPLWLLPYLAVFGFGIWFFAAVGKDEELSVLMILLFTLLIFGFLSMYLRHYLAFDENGLSVGQTYRKAFLVSYENIENVFTRQTHLQKILGLYDVFIKFASQKQKDNITLRAFGLSYQYYQPAYLPGVWGEIVTTPSVTANGLRELLEELAKYTKVKGFNHLGVGFPVYSTASKASYYLSLILSLLFLLLVAIVIAIFAFQ